MAAELAPCAARRSMLRHRRARCAVAAVLAAVLAPAARAQSQAWDEAYWGEVFGDRRCPGGEGWNGFLETCVACPEGMQSRQNSTQPCSFCPHTLMPAEPARDGCVCQEHYFNQWPSSAAADFAKCTSCEKVMVTPWDAPARTRCETCDDASSVSSSPCAKTAQCECKGAAKGEATVCPAWGYYLDFGQHAEASPGGAQAVVGESSRKPAEAEMPDTEEARAAEYEMLQCSSPRDGLGSRCQHWTRCIREADTEQDSWNDPEEVQRAADFGLPRDKQVYVSDAELEAWLAKEGAGNRGKSCPTEISEENPQGPNCCLPGYTGRICEDCVSPLVKVDGYCLACDGVNLKRVSLGILMSLGFVLLMMRKSVERFKDCNGKASIAVFFLQTVMLLYKDRVPDVLNIGANFMDVSFLRNTKTSCTIEMGYHGLFFFNLLSTLVVMLVVYIIVLVVTHTTLKSKEITSYVAHTVSRARAVTLAEDVLGSIMEFKMLSHKERHEIAQDLDVTWFKFGDDILCEGDVPGQADSEGNVRDHGQFYIIAKGEVAVKIRHHQGEGVGPDATIQQVGTMKAGEYFGQVALLHESPRTATITAISDVQALSLDNQKFRSLQKRYKDNKEFIAQFHVLRHEGQDRHLLSEESKAMLGKHNSSDHRAEELAKHKFVVTYTRRKAQQEQRRVDQIDQQIDEGACCGCCGWVALGHERVKKEITGIYTACINPTARYCAALGLRKRTFAQLCAAFSRFCLWFISCCVAGRDPDLHVRPAVAASFVSAVLQDKPRRPAVLSHRAHSQLRRYRP